MVFKGGKKYRSAQAVSAAVDSFGGEFNASTSKEFTLFYIKSRVDYREAAFDVLSDIVLSPLLKPADITREKGVIKAEIDMYEDTPVRKIEDIYENLIYQNHTLGRDIIGTKSTVNSISRSDFKSYLKAHYHSSNLLLTIAGGVNQKQVLRLAQKYFGRLPQGQPQPTQAFRTQQSQPQVKLKYKKTDQAHFIIGYRGAPLGHPDRYPEVVLASVLGGGMSSRLFTEVREKRGLAYAVKTYADHYSDTGRFTTYAGVTPAKASDAIRVILKEYQCMSSLNDCKVSSKELKKAQEFLKGRLALSLEDTSRVNSFFGVEELLLGRTRTLAEVYAGVDAVTVPDLVRVARHFFRPERLNFAAIGPFKDENKFTKLLN